MKYGQYLFASTLLSLTAAPALAQTKAPVDLTGNYSQTCDHAAVTVGFQRFEVQSSSDSVVLTTPTNLSFTLNEVPCNPATISKAAEDAYDSCNGLLLPFTPAFKEDLCQGVATGIESALSAATARFNGRFVTQVDPGGSVNDFFNLYGMDGDIVSPDGRVRDGGYLVNRAGDFVGARFAPAIFNAKGICGLAAGTLTEGVKGKIDREQGYDLSAAYGGDLSLFCNMPGEQEGQTLTFRIGLSMQASLSGERLSD